MVSTHPIAAVQTWWISAGIAVFVVGITCSYIEYATSASGIQSGLRPFHQQIGNSPSVPGDNTTEATETSASGTPKTKRNQSLQRAGGRIIPMLRRGPFRDVKLLDDLRAQLHELDSIPKVAHFTWKERFNPLESDSTLIQSCWGSFARLNPDWEIKMSNDSEVRRYLQAVLQPEYWEAMRNANIVGMTDLWRLLKMYIEGGVYMDIDRLVNIPMSDILTPATRVVLPTNRGSGLRSRDLLHDISQDFMCTAPKNPIFFNAIDELLRRRWICHFTPENPPEKSIKCGDQSLETLWAGPMAYFYGVTLNMTGMALNQHLKPMMITFFEGVLKYLEPEIVTFPENPPFNTILHSAGSWYDTPKTNYQKYKEQLREFEVMKDSFFQRYNMSHWTTDHRTKDGLPSGMSSVDSRPPLVLNLNNLPD